MVKTVLVGLVTLALIGPAYAAPDKAPESTLVGIYSCEGTNPDGGTYSGIVEIIKHHDAYLVRWTMPDDTQVVGIGILSGGMLSVSYFGGTPSLVVYSVAENGKLNGTWTAVGAEGELFTETLTKMPAGSAPRPAKPAKRDSRPRPRITV
jgi:hypothetical protein